MKNISFRDLPEEIILLILSNLKETKDIIHFSTSYKINNDNKEIFYLTTSVKYSNLIKIIYITDEIVNVIEIDPYICNINKLVIEYRKLMKKI